MSPHRWSRRVRGLAAVVCLALVAACSGDDGERSAGGGLGQLLGGESGGGTVEVEVAAGAPVDEAGEWTIFVYLAADNDLEPFALQDLDEMLDAEGVQFIVLLDRHPGYTNGDAIGLGDFDGTKLIRIRDGVVEELEDMGELDTGSSETLADFVADGLRDHASDRNGLVIWNHGAGWPGAAVDETSGRMLSLAAIRDGIADGLDRADVDRLDLVGFDACLMATYEVAQNLRGVSRTLLASEELEPGHGWNWSALTAPGGTISTVDLAQSVLDGFADQSSTYGTSGVTLSLVDLDLLDPIEDAFVAMTEAVDANAAGLVGRISARRSEALGFGSDPDPAYDYHLVDVGHLAGLMSDIDGMADAAGQLEAAVADAVLVNITDSTTAQATGLAVYFPPLAELGRPSYEQVSDIGPWTDFLAAYYTGAEGIPASELPAFLDEDRWLDIFDVDYQADSISFSVDVTPGSGINISSSKLFWGQVDLDDSDLVAFFGERLAVIEEDTIHAEYNWRYLVIEDGSTEAAAYSQLDLGPDGEVRRIVVPIRYATSRNEVRGVLVLGVENGDVISETFYGYTDEGTVGEIQPSTGDTFVPQLLVQSLDDFSSEWVDSTSTPLAADADRLEHHMRRLAPLTPVMLELNLTDVEGGMDYVFHGNVSP